MYFFKDSKDYAELFKFNSTRLGLFSGDVREQQTSYFINIFFENIENLPLFSISKLIYKILVRPRNGYWIKFEKNILLRQNADKIFSYFQHEFSKKDTYFNSIENILARSDDNYFKGLFLDYFNKVLFDEKTAYNQRSNSFKYIFIVDPVRNINSLLNAFNNKNKDVIEVVTSFFIDIKPEDNIYRKKRNNKSLIDFYCCVLTSDQSNSDCKASILKIAEHNNERLDTIAIDIFQNEFGVGTTTAALDYFVKFKTEKAIKHIEYYIRGYYGLTCFYTLTMLNPDYYDRYIELFKDEYKKATNFLKEIENFDEGIDQIMQVFDILYVGDQKMLNLLQSKEHIFEKGAKRRIYFYQSMIKKLTSKCELLNQIKKPFTLEG